MSHAIHNFALLRTTFVFQAARLGTKALIAEGDFH
jgi:hypothetical protein